MKSTIIPAIKKYTVKYKRITTSPFISGRIANVDIQTAVVEAGNAAGAEAQVRKQQKMFMNNDIRVIDIIREIEPDTLA